MKDDFIFYAIKISFLQPAYNYNRLQVPYAPTKSSNTDIAGRENWLPLQPHMRRKIKPELLTEIAIERMAGEGKCLARVNGQVIFVSGVAPGDVVDLRIVKKKKNYLEGAPIKFHTYSVNRTEPFCQHFSICGGCKWQHIDYEYQLTYKQQEVVDQLTRIGKVELPPVTAIIGSDKTQEYRNKLEFTFSSKRWLTREEIALNEDINRNGLGFHMPGQFDKVLEIQHCHLQEEPSNAIRLAIKNYVLAADLSFYDLVNHGGLLRNLIIRTSSTGEVMVIVQFGEENPEAIQQLMHYVQTTFPEITSLQYVVNTKKNETFNDLEVICFSGKPYITEKMENLEFRIGPKSFYQTNSSQAYALYKVAREFAGLTGAETVYDLYTGTGTIAQFVASQAKKVVGIEYVPEAIEDAKENTRLNGLNNCYYYAGDMKDLLNEELIQKEGQPDVIITDPPRAGMHADVVKTLLDIAPKKIVYVSCNPSTQARDLAMLDTTYAIKLVQPVDMFPHTHHVENVVLLEKR